VKELRGFATGWFVVATADELGPGGVLPLRYFGQKLVAFRGESLHSLPAHQFLVDFHLTENISTARRKARRASEKKQYMVSIHACVDFQMQNIYSFIYVLLSKYTLDYVHIGPSHDSVVDTLQRPAPVEFRVTRNSTRTDDTYSCASCSASTGDGTISAVFYVSASGNGTTSAAFSVRALIRILHRQAKFLHLRCGQG